MKKAYLNLEQIETQGLQTRAQLDMETVREYAEAEKERGAVFPPVTVFSDGDKYWLADGFHRVAMARQQGKKKVAAEIHDGGRADAVWFACGANKEHGRPRTNADKRRALEIALKMRPEMSDGDLAQHVGVSRVFVNNFRRTLAGQGVNGLHPDTRVGTDGKTYSVPPVPTRRLAPQALAPEPEAAAERGPEEAFCSPVPTRPPPGRQAPAPEPEEDAGPGPQNDSPALPPPTCPPPVRQAPGPGPEEDAGPGPEASAPTPPPTRQGPPQRRTAPADDPAMTDGRGREIPPELAEIWNRRKEISDLARQVGQARSALKAAQAGNDPLWAEINHSSVQAALDRAYGEIAAAMPWCVCPMCQGIGCRACKGRGLLGKTRFEAVVPRELRG